MRVLAPLAVVLCLAAPAVASADAPRNVVVILGLATPHGEIGIDAGITVHPIVTLSTGVGLSFNGVQVAWMARLQTPTRPVRGYLGLGLSCGNYEAFDPVGVDDARAKVLWDNTELGIEVFAGSLLVRVFGGLGVGVNPGKLPRGADGLPYVGLGVGSTF